MGPAAHAEERSILQPSSGKRGVLLVVSGPSGSGKDTLVGRLRELEPDLAYSVSATTRSPRPGEIDGRHYHFLTRAAFEALARADGFVETREYAGNLYGTPRRFIEDTLATGHDIVMKPEVNGALAIKLAYPAAVLVFLTVPSEHVLERRLVQRNTESPEAIALRVAIAQREAQAVRDYEYLVVNDQVEHAVAQLHAILIAERLRVSRLVL